VPQRFDTIIIGAGAAGLAAARELSGAGHRLCILEARQRLGGRIFTLHTPDLPLPIELGAEFIHGEEPTTFAIVEAAALLAYELPDIHWWLSRGRRWELVDGFRNEIDALKSRIPASPDRSFADFLKSQKKLPRRLRELAVSFVEGYHAAHADRISAVSLRSSDEEEDPGGNRQFRIANGYDALLAWLRAGLHPERTEVRHSAAVIEVEWRKGDVAVRTSRGDEVRSRAAVITIPIGVWKASREQSGAIRFRPGLRAKQNAIAKLEVGHVVKIIFRFRERFWDEPDFLKKRAKASQAERGTPINFVHGNDRYMPTWWTMAPVRAPLLTGWAGGHAADALLAEGEEAFVDRALDSLASTFCVRRREIESLLESTHLHNWQADPFSRGAYSYAGVGGSGAHDLLAKSVEGTLFFAGEATSTDQTGTVAGAIESGRRAAKELLG
jgi:monoamine oxidase